MVELVLAQGILIYAKTSDAMNKKNAQREKTDFSLVEEVMKSDKRFAAQRAEVGQPLQSAEIVPVEMSDVPTAPKLSLPDSNLSRGILARWQANTISRKAALEQLQSAYDAQLGLLKHQLEQAVTMKKAQADVIAKEYLKHLDAQQLEILTKLDLKNKGTREKALLELTEDTAARLKEVQNSDWPDILKADTVKQLFQLRERYVAEMMKELGSY